MPRLSVDDPGVDPDVSADVVVGGAMDPSSTAVDDEDDRGRFADVNNEGGAHVHGAVSVHVDVVSKRSRALP